jgi:hypothetical protein
VNAVSAFLAEIEALLGRKTMLSVKKGKINHVANPPWRCWIWLFALKVY